MAAKQEHESTPDRRVAGYVRGVLVVVAIGFLLVDLFFIGYLLGPARKEDSGNCVGGDNLKGVTLIVLPLAAVLVAVLPGKYDRPWIRNFVMATLLASCVLVVLLTRATGLASGDC